MMPRYIVFFAIALSFPMASAADFQKTWDNAADRRITIFTPHGDIKLIGYDGKTIDISAVKKGSNLERVIIEDASAGNHIHIFSRYLNPAQSNATVDFEIRVPKEIFYNADSISKPQGGRAVGLQRFQDGVPAPPPPPDASASPKPKPPQSSDTATLPKPPPPPPGMFRPPKVSPPPGAMRFTYAIFLKTNSGQITISDVMGAVLLEGRGIEIQNFEGMLNASSGSGDIKGTLKQASRPGLLLRLSSSSGSISLQAPDNISAQVHIQSTTGQVKTDFPLETGEMRYGGKFIRGKLGDGNQVLDIRSLSGAITFSKKPSETKDKQALNIGSPDK